ncbi:MAG: mobile mystery protein A [Deltaproteobacteria bacterium]|nr:MAG: mobile mystery protein A [Deltaproteobacteria bacterium]
MTRTSLKNWQIEKKIRLLRARLSTLPKRGWIQMIREALGMSGSQLASRLSISRQALSRLEKNEFDGSISISSLERVAQALQCEVLVALIPKKTLESIIQEQAENIARKLVERSQLHMTLENQGTDRNFLERQIKTVAQELQIKNPKILWNKNDV